MRLPAPRSSVALLLIAIQLACARTLSAPAEPVEIRGPVVLDDAAIDALGELLRMEDARAYDDVLARRHARSSVPEVRARTALAAARTGDRSALPLLLTLLADSDAEVRERAAFAIGELGDSSDVAVAGLAASALSDRPAVAAEAAAAIGRLGAQGGRPAIDSLLAAPRHTHVLHEALLAAWRLPRDEATQRRVVRWTADADPETRWRAAYALARNGGAGVIAPLLGLVDDPDARVRALAIRGLRAGAADSAGSRAAARAALLAAAGDTHPHVRINAINLLPGYDGDAGITQALTAALEDLDANVAVAAAQALGQVRDQAAAFALRRAALSVRADALRSAALLALVRVDRDGALEIAADWADSARWLPRLYSARALARATPAPAATLLHSLARDPHYLVASEALGSIRALGDSVADARSLYIELLAAPHPLVRAAAARGLATNAGSADLDLLMQAYDRARQDTVRDAATAAVLALARLRRANIPVERAFFLRFGAAGPPADAALHRLIEDSIGTPPPHWGEPAPRIQLRSPDFYRGIVRTYVAPVLAGGRPPHVVIATSGGEIELELASADAPLTVHNFLSLIEQGYYRNTRWHRVVPNFVIQDGDPRGDGSGGPGYAIRDEINALRYERGTLGMALSGPDTGGSQYFITHSPQPHLDGGYTVFGRVAGGMDVVDRVTQDELITFIRAQR